ncbi:ATP-dependent DNA helicase RecG [Irregularibacter muris]|uniref:ATP-dependent DNA helicase RecG n=1 Tax=Irregularibacter muris TaxID=1796619 RepID=A0AAE3HFM5_9FIRM|nr:ATP-dependent DNA helicase RecG [Irregularibacter muris]MCR1898159.1 ATP-dependent DNA helicase RecG [Irregularibacter muris]
MNVKDSIKNLKGIGPKKYEQFKKIGVETIEDLVYFFPRDYEDRRKITPLSQCKDQEYTGIVVKITGRGMEELLRGRKLRIIKIPIEDKGVVGEAIWYNTSFMKNTFKIGGLYYLYGKIKRGYGKIQIITPDYKIIDDLSYKGQGILPVYPLSTRLTQKDIRKFMIEAISAVKGQWEEYLPMDLRKKYKLCEINFALENIHFPTNLKNYEIGKKRLIFDEFFLLQMGLHLIKAQNTKNISGITFNIDSRVEKFIEELPFQLTNAQKKVIKELEEDLSTGKIINRLIQGDVGSGKTIIGAIALLMAYLNGYQGVMMVPTEILAKQHYETLNSLFKKFNIKIGLLIGSLKAKDKKNITEKIQSGEIDIVIGTHALIQDNVKFNKIGLVITDEQHRFGVKQRALLNNKGENPHVLVMTATPIPRTLAFILYGDLDISIIDELPPGRKKVETYHVNERYETRIYNFIKKQIKLGRQAYIVCPLVEDSESIDAQSVITLTEHLKNNIFRDEKISLLHGKMQNQEKDVVMQRFKDGEIDILISTTVIEVGVNVPNATIMLVHNAERFGLAQLHQLRGRIGRGEHQSYCILITNHEGKLIEERMKTLVGTDDGFIIAEKDLALRGPGEFLGLRQHGLPELKIANLIEDVGILKMSQDVLKEIFQEGEYSEMSKFVLENLQEKIHKIALN